MDEQRFDQITKRLGTARTRRATLKGVGLALLGAAGLATGLEAEAKGKGKRHGTSNRVQTTCVNPTVCVAGNPDHACCQGYNCNNGVCQCNLGSCQSNADCPCAHVTTCATFGPKTGECCRNELGFACFPQTVGGDCCGPTLVCTDATAGTCQCNTAAGFVQVGTDSSATCACDATKNLVNCNGVCINKFHQCCPSDPTIGLQCPAGQTCGADNTCAATTTCVPIGDQPCNVNHVCCHPDQFHCSSTTTANGTCVANQCVSDGGTCNLNNPCCHPELFHCSSTTTANGTCVPNTNCTGGQVPCGDQCINPDTQCCADEAIGVLCPDGKKCCPAGHTCNRNKNGTYNCGKGNGVSARQGRGRKQR